MGDGTLHLGGTAQREEAYVHYHDSDGLRIKEMENGNEKGNKRGRVGDPSEAEGEIGAFFSYHGLSGQQLPFPVLFSERRLLFLKRASAQSALQKSVDKTATEAGRRESQSWPHSQRKSCVALSKLHHFSVSQFPRL